jgi:hypothetical protein
MDFWDVHGWLFLASIIFFPRFTMLIATAPPFGALAWLGWLVWPKPARSDPRDDVLLAHESTDSASPPGC